MNRSIIWSARSIGVGLLLVGIFVSRAEAGRKFYLTQEVFKGNEALTACAKGYHMASLWEIFNVSGLTYNTKLGAALDDSGSGPSVLAGWVRTGFIGSASSSSGSGNCRVWTSASPTDEGSLVNLTNDWQGASNKTAPWDASSSLCSNNIHVWCVAGK
jgi:hypothetical protein